MQSNPWAPIVNPEDRERPSKLAVASWRFARPGPIRAWSNQAQNTGWPLHDQLTPDLTSEWRVIGDLGGKVPTLKASGHDPRFECQTTQDQSVSFARLHLVIS